VHLLPRVWLGGVLMRSLVALIATVTLASCSGQMVYTHGVPNLVEVAPGQYRGGQPTLERWDYLQSRGVRTIVKLNYDTEDPDEPSASMLGMVVHRVPFPPSGVDDALGGPTVAQMRQAVAWLSDPKLRPVYVHCSHGHDRTGLVVGTYRVTRGWSKAKAWDEMVKLGYHPVALGLTDFWRDHVPLAPSTPSTKE